ncbi:hypothetical protein H0H92_004316 [Tricholoma furcatifolium]|nr:hypothetical protein H0H92_004316 [Tricholoma furcatifolium]
MVPDALAIASCVRIVGILYQLFRQIHQTTEMVVFLFLWDSAEVGITFEKPTGLAAQLQKYEDSAPESLEFDRLKEHFEPYIRAASLSSSTTTAPSVAPSSAAHSHHLHSTSITAAAAALARDIPGVSKYNPLGRSVSARGGSGKDRSRNKDEMTEYKSRVTITSASKVGTGGGEVDVEYMKHLETIGEVASLEQRWTSSWAAPLQTRDLRPLRIPLHSKRSKRCPACTHILIKPEQKAQSVRYKIKLVAATYLPAITVALPTLEHVQADAARRTTGKAALEDDRISGSGIHAGKTYPFQLALTNPLYDPIQVRLSVQRMHISTMGSTEGGASTEKARRPPFIVSLPTTPFAVAAFAEAWEYDDDEEMFGVDEDDDFGLGRSGREKDRGKAKTVGVLEKRANTTIVGGEVVIGKEARGSVRFNMLVQFTYRSDDTAPSEGHDGSPSKTTKAPEIKTFTFYTVVDLGNIIPREEHRMEVDTTMASITGSSTPSIEITPPSPREQAGPLPLKRGEIGYVEGAEEEAGSSSADAEVVLPARHPADRDASVTSAVPPETPVPSPSIASPSTSTLISSESNHSERSKVLSFFKPKKIPTFCGLRLTTLLIFFLQLALIGATLAGWVILVKVTAHQQSNVFGTTTVFIHVVFGVGLLAQFLFLERRIYRLRAERYTYLHPGQILPSSRNGRGYPGIAFSPWNRPPLPTYAAALAESGAGTGDVEDHMIAAPPPPAYGNTRGSTLLLSGFLRDSLRAQRPPSVHSRPQSGESQMMSQREERPVSYVSRDEEWEEIQDADRARRLEETLAHLERPTSRSSA